MNQPLRVMLLVGELRIGGAERQLVELAKGLDRSRFYPIVATLYKGWPLEQELVNEDVHLVSLERRRKEFTTLPKLVGLLRRERVQIIQPYLTPSSFFGFAASMIARTPVKIGTVRCGTQLNTGDGLSLRLYRFAEELLIRFADAVIPNSEAGRDCLIARGVRHSRTPVIYNGINPSRVAVSENDSAEVRRRLRLPADARVVGIVARLAPEKDHETFLRAAAHVREALPNTYFIVVGDGPLRPRLEALACQLGLASHALFVGSQLRVAPFIHCFDVAVLSSYDIEGCSNFLLEAMALGKPVVCTDIGGNRELITDGVNGFLVPPKAPEELARRILSILEDQAGARAMGKEARRSFQGRFTLEHMVHQYEELYQELWSKHAGGTGAGYSQQGPLKTEPAE